MSLQLRLFQEIAAVGGTYVELRQLAVARERERNLDTRRSETPHLAEHVGQAGYALACDFDDHVAEPHTGAFRRPAPGNSADDQALLRFRGVHPQPRTGRPRRRAILQHVVEYGWQEIDRYEHVALNRLAVLRLLHQQRSDAEKFSVGPDQRRTAPLRMRRRRKERLVEHVL